MPGVIGVRPPTSTTSAPSASLLPLLGEMERQMTETAAHFMALALENAGVKRVYGVVGDSLNGFTDALRKRGNIDWIHVRHEESGAFAAGAEAQLTGELAVCVGSCGPGNLHMI